MYLVVHDGVNPSDVESQCYTFHTEEEAVSEAKACARQFNQTYNVFKLVQTHTFLSPIPPEPVRKISM
jgi:hypothetical protein